MQTDKNLIEFNHQFLRKDQRFLRILTKFEKRNASEQHKLKKEFPKALVSSSLQKSNHSLIGDFLIKNTLGIGDMQ